MFLRKLFLTCGMLVYIIGETGTISKFSAHNFRTHFDLSLTGPKQARPPMGFRNLTCTDGSLWAPQLAHSSVAVNDSTNGPFPAEHMFFDCLDTSFSSGKCITIDTMQTRTAFTDKKEFCHYMFHIE